MKVSVKKTIIVLLDVLLAVYLGFAVTSFNNPDETMKACSNVSIQIDDETTNGFLSAKEIKNILEQKKLYPYEKPMAAINPRSIEEALKSTSFVNTSQCYKTKDGHVVINITQRLPIVRIKNNKGQDFYVDDQGGVMPNSKYTSDLIIATGNVNEWFAKNYISHLTKALMENPLWRNQIEQMRLHQQEAHPVGEVLQIRTQPGRLEQILVHQPGVRQPDYLQEKSPQRKNQSE